VDFNLHIPANALAAVTLLGLVSSNVRFATKRHWLRARWPVQWTLTAVLAGLMAYLAVQDWRRDGEILWTARAEQQPNFSNEQAAALQKAFACEPGNYWTAYKLGECFRTQSLDGGENYVKLAQTALGFYAQGIRLNPHDALCQLCSGMCLDWLEHHADAEKYYETAESLDPNGNFVVSNIGWHYVQMGDYAAARQWFMRANTLANWSNDTSKNYLLEICEPKLMEKASGRLPMRMFYDGKDN
jgi:tetratricopeptide (TPR) repeat protein